MRLSTRLTVAMVGLVALTATAVGLLINLNIEQSAVPRALDRIDTHAHVLAQQLESAVRGARADVSVQGQAIEALVQAMTSGATETAVAVLRDRIASRFTAELSAKPQYSRFRLIGVADGGREIVRVDRRGPSGAIRIVPEAE